MYVSSTIPTKVTFFVANPGPLAEGVIYRQAHTFTAGMSTGMDQTPGSKDESLVAESQRLGEEVDVERRVQLLISFTTQVVFGYVAQASY